jgi:hypothetical protein
MSLGEAYVTLFGTIAIILSVAFLLDWYEKRKGKKGN